MKTLMIFTALFLGIIEVSYAQQKNPLVINLGELDPMATYSINENKNVVYDYLVLKNAVAGFSYSISIDKEFDTIPALSFQPKDTKVEDSEEEKALSDPCSKLKAEIKNVKDIYDANIKELT